MSRQDVRRAAAADEIEQQSWQLTGAWVLTGETATGRAIAPRKPFDPGKGAWGAFEIVARANALTVDDAAFPVFANPDASARAGDRRRRRPQLVPESQREDCRRLRADALRSRRRSPAADRPDEHALFTRFQIAF